MSTPTCGIGKAAKWLYHGEVMRVPGIASVYLRWKKGRAWGGTPWGAGDVRDDGMRTRPAEFRLALVSGVLVVPENQEGLRC